MKKFIFVIFIITVIICYYTEVNKIYLYQILRYLFIIPIILSTFYFNIKGGVISPMICNIFYLPFLIKLINKQGITLNSLELVLLLFFLNYFGIFLGVVIKNMNYEEDKLSKLINVLTNLNDKIEEKELINTINNLLSSISSCNKVNFYKYDKKVKYNKLEKKMLDWVSEHKACLINDNIFAMPIMKGKDLLATIIGKYEEDEFVKAEDLKLIYMLENQFVLSLDKSRQYKEVIEEKEYLDSIINNLPYGILALDKNNEIKFCNEVTNKLLNDNIPFELLKEDSYFELNYNDLPIGVRYTKLDQDKIFCFKDISDKKKILTLQDKNKIKSEFISIVQHELKTPLTSIKGFIKTIQDDNFSKEEKEEFYKIITSEVDRLKKIINNFLNLKIIEEQNELVLNLEKFSIINLIEKIINSKKMFTNIHQFVIINNTDKIIIHADYDKIYQVMYNLIDNAIKYSPLGGKVKIEIEDENDYLKIEIIDEGIGIPKMQINNLFKKFCRINREKYSNIKGMGFGLYLVQYIIDKHNGKIFVESEEDKGSKFTILLPYVF